LPSLLPSETVGQSYPKDRRLRDYPVSIENQLNNQNHDIEIPVLRSITIFPGPLDEVSRQGNPWFVTDFGLPRGVKVDELGVREKRVKRQGCAGMAPFSHRHHIPGRHARANGQPAAAIVSYTPAATQAARNSKMAK
jgi:hypothetical protein